jgi:peptide deformylase
MSVLRIALLGNPVLRKPAEQVAYPRDPAVRELVGHMEDTLIDSQANGIAAPQIGVSRAVVLYRIAESKIPRGSSLKPLPLRALVNPAFEPIGDDMIFSVERCLSIPYLQGSVPRFRRGRVKAQTLDGDAIEIDAEGYHAILLQHEIDHLNGTMFIDRMSNMSTLMFQSEASLDLSRNGG